MVGCQPKVMCYQSFSFRHCSIYTVLCGGVKWLITNSTWKSLRAPKPLMIWPPTFNQHWNYRYTWYSFCLNIIFLDTSKAKWLLIQHTATKDYCTNPINSSVTRHRGSEIDEILRGHRSQGSPTKPPGQSKIRVKNRFFAPLSLATLELSSTMKYFKLSTDRGETLCLPPAFWHFDEFFWWSHLPQWCDETNISSCRSQVTRCDKLIELVQ